VVVPIAVPVVVIETLLRDEEVVEGKPGEHHPSVFRQ